MPAGPEPARDAAGAPRAGGEPEPEAPAVAAFKAPPAGGVAAPRAAPWARRAWDAGVQAAAKAPPPAYERAAGGAPWIADARVADARAAAAAPEAARPAAAAEAAAPRPPPKAPPPVYEWAAGEAPWVAAMAADARAAAAGPWAAPAAADLQIVRRLQAPEAAWVAEAAEAAAAAPAREEEAPLPPPAGHEHEWWEPGVVPVLAGGDLRPVPPRGPLPGRFCAWCGGPLWRARAWPLAIEGALLPGCELCYTLALTRQYAHHGHFTPGERVAVLRQARELALVVAALAGHADGPRE